MPTPNPQYVMMPPIQQVIHHPVTGELLAGGWVYFYSETSPTTPKTVYEQTLVGSSYVYTALPNPLQLDSIGQYTNTNNPSHVVFPYAFPYDANGDVELYKIIVCGPLDPDPTTNALFTVENFPGIQSIGGGVSGSESSDNQLVNGQFLNVQFLNSDGTFPVSGNVDVQIAPGWTISASGSGSFTVQRVALTPSANEPTNAPYYLSITSTGLTSLRLYQRILNAPVLFDELFMNAGLSVKSGSASAVNYQVNYNNTAGGSTEFFSGTTSASWTYRGETALIPAQSAGTPTGDTGWIELSIALQANLPIFLTSIQLAEVSASNSSKTYIQESPVIQRSHTLGSYYDALVYSPRPSLLTAWEFANNPCQFLGPTHTVTTASYNLASRNAGYVWDQTIMGASGNNFAVTREVYSMKITPTAGSTSVTLIQYADADWDSQLFEALRQDGQQFSVNVAALTPSLANSCTAKVSLLVSTSASASSFGTFTSLTGLGTTLPFSVSAAGALTINDANWSLVSNGATSNSATVGTSRSPLDDLGFSGFSLTNTQINTGVKFAIVVTFTFSSATPLYVTSISLCQGNLPSRPVTVPYSTVLQECQAFYEKSYPADKDNTNYTLNGSGVYNTLYTSIAGSRTLMTDYYYNASDTEIYSPSYSTTLLANKRVNTLSATFNTFAPWSTAVAATTGNLVGLISFQSKTVIAPGTNFYVNAVPLIANTCIVEYNDTTQNIYTYSNQTVTVQAAVSGTLLYKVSTANTQGILQYHYIVDQRYGVI